MTVLEIYKLELFIANAKQYLLKQNNSELWVTTYKFIHKQTG